MAIESINQRIAPPDPALAQHVEKKLPVLLQILEEWWDGPLGIPQGYTYLGQFLAHDIAPRPGANQRTWKFDLDSVYPARQEHDKIDPQTALFRYQPGRPGFLPDLVRDPVTKKALIPEFRNDDQLIIAQLHLLIQLFHNNVTGHLVIHPAMSGVSKEVLLAHAREYVCACIQRIIMDDYLRHICDPNVYTRLWSNARPVIINIKDSEAGLPYDITHGAGRFGHSMVRASYSLSIKNGKKQDFSLLDLFTHTGEHNPTYGGTPIKMKIDWDLFFYNSPVRKRELAQRINPAIVTPMKLPPNPNIVEMNLQAGIGKQLSSGQELAKNVIQELGRQNIDSLGISPNLSISLSNAHLQARLEALNLWDATPLWLFILLEADSSATGGMQLGPLGSLLTLEIAKNAIRLPGSGSYDQIQNRYETSFGLRPVGSMYDLIQQAQIH